MKGCWGILQGIKYAAFLLSVMIFSYLNMSTHNKVLIYVVLTVLTVYILFEIFIKTKVSLIRQDDRTISVELELKARELDALNDISMIITSTHDIDQMLDSIYKTLNMFTGCDRCFISLLDKDTHTLVCKYEFGDIVLGEVGNCFDEDSAITMCFKNNKTIIQSDVLIKSRGIQGDKAAIPLKMCGEVIGVVFIESSVPYAFNNINVVFVENLANYAVIAVRNADLFNNILIQKQEIQALYEQAAAVNGTLNMYINELDKTKMQLEIKNKELTKFYEGIQVGYFQTVMALANSIEAKDSYTRGHCQRVMEISCEIAKRMGFSDDEIQDLKYAAILHDIGKIGISRATLNKTERFTEEEYEEIKRHPIISYNILKDIEFLRNALKAILQHHERYDGKGYPYNLCPDEICDFAKILGVSDAFDAMTSDRPYRKAMSLEQALLEIENGKGTQFDPKVSDIFLEMGKELLADTCTFDI